MQELFMYLIAIIAFDRWPHILQHPASRRHPVTSTTEHEVYAGEKPHGSRLILSGCDYKSWHPLFGWKCVQTLVIDPPHLDKFKQYQSLPTMDLESQQAPLASCSKAGRSAAIVIDWDPDG